jgi:hypothetical protein
LDVIASNEIEEAEGCDILLCEDTFDGMGVKELVRSLLVKLSEVERKIISLRYGFTDDEDRTCQEIGHELGLTKQRVRYIENRALEKLKKVLEQEYFIGKPDLTFEERGGLSNLLPFNVDPKLSKFLTQNAKLLVGNSPTILKALRVWKMLQRSRRPKGGRQDKDFYADARRTRSAAKKV